MVLSTRSEAGRHLGETLAPWIKECPLVFAVSPGGARVAFEVAQRLAAPLDLVYARRLEVPGRRRSLFGAVTRGAVRVSRPAMKALALPKPYVKNLVAFEEHAAELDERAQRGAANPLELSGRLVILVDDGFAEPLVVIAAIASLRARRAARVVFAVPVLTPEMEQVVTPKVDRIVTLSGPDREDPPMICDEFFAQTTLDDVRQMVRLSRHPAELVPA